MGYLCNSKDHGLLYNKLFGLRQDADYQDFRNLKKEEVTPLISLTENFIMDIKELI